MLFTQKVWIHEGGLIIHFQLSFIAQVIEKDEYGSARFRSNEAVFINSSIL